MRHLGLQRVIINPLLPRGHSCVTIKVTHMQLSGSLPHLSLMDFALGMVQPPAVQNGSLFSSTNLLQCLSDLSGAKKVDYKSFSSVFLTPFPYQNLETQAAIKT